MFDTCYFCAINLRENDFSIWNVEWPARSPDLTNLDFFLWDYVKEMVYKDTPQTVTDLIEALDKEITINGSEVTKAVIDSVEKTLRTVSN